MSPVFLRVLRTELLEDGYMEEMQAYHEANGLRWRKPAARELKGARARSRSRSRSRPRATARVEEEEEEDDESDDDNNVTRMQ